MATLGAAVPAATSAFTPTTKGQTYRGPFAIMTVLFFMWGVMTVWNDILIPRFKEAFTLSYFQAMLVQFTFFGAYAIGSLIYSRSGTNGFEPAESFTGVQFFRHDPRSDQRRLADFQIVNAGGGRLVVLR